MQPDRLNEKTPKKRCVICEQEKETDQFYLKSREGSKRYAKCIPCYTAHMRQYRKEHRDAYNAIQRKHWNKYRDRNIIRHKERKYGLARGEYQTMRDSQDGKCGICKSDLVGSGHLDHDHDTGRPRGLLCKTCNTGLGNFQDNIELLINAIEYLEMRQSDLMGKEPSESDGNNPTLL